jgi:hypothetical protein
VPDGADRRDHDQPAFLAPGDEVPPRRSVPSRS